MSGYGTGFARHVAIGFGHAAMGCYSSPSHTNELFNRMNLKLTHLLLAFAVGLGCSVVFTFPSWSLGSVRTAGDAKSLDNGFAKLAPPRDGGGGSHLHVVIDKSAHTLTINLPGKSPVAMKAQGAYALKSGAHTVVSKERDPLWRAPPTYFLRRGQPVPADNSTARSMRGALGHQALFLDGSATIHSGPIWNDDVGGIKVSPQDMAILFEAVDVGATVEIR